MSLVKSEAIILKSRPFSESSKILTVFTREMGQVAILVKGGRKGRKKFPGGLETLNRVELQFYHRSGRELQNYKTSDLLESYRDIGRDLQRSYTALSLLETVLRTTAPEDANPDLYSDLVETLTALNLEERNPWSLRWYGLLRICRSLGFEWSLQDCCRCGARGPMGGFNLNRGSFVCAACQQKKPEPISTPGEIWGVLRFLSTCPPQVATRVNVSPEIGAKIESLFLRYFRYQFPNLKSFATWKELPKIYWGEKQEN